jgi:hypothetical protein
MKDVTYAVLLNYRIYAMLRTGFPSGLKLKKFCFRVFFTFSRKLLLKNYNYVCENLGENEHMLTFP